MAEELDRDIASFPTNSSKTHDMEQLLQRNI